MLIRSVKQGNSPVTGACLILAWVDVTSIPVLGVGPKVLCPNTLLEALSSPRIEAPNDQARLGVA